MRDGCLAVADRLVCLFADTTQGANANATAAGHGALGNFASGGADRTSVTFGHPPGTLQVGAESSLVNGQSTATNAIMSRSARVFMEGWVRVPK